METSELSVYIASDGPAPIDIAALAKPGLLRRSLVSIFPLGSALVKPALAPAGFGDTSVIAALAKPALLG